MAPVSRTTDTPCHYPWPSPSSLSRGINSAPSFISKRCPSSHTSTGCLSLESKTLALSLSLSLQDKELADYNPADISMALCRMISYNIGQVRHGEHYDNPDPYIGQTL